VKDVQNAFQEFKNEGSELRSLNRQLDYPQSGWSDEKRETLKQQKEACGQRQIQAAKNYWNLKKASQPAE